MNDLASQFINPGMDFRGKPFWSWNGDLKEDELIRQIHVMKEMGLGGFFMHSRTGLITEYLGDEWFRLTNVCADEAAQLGMEAWLYDEDRWPSGTAGGLVTQNPAFRSHYLRLHVLSAADFHWRNDLIAAFTCRLEGDSYFELVRLEKGDHHTGNLEHTVLAFTIETMRESSFYNGATYVDTLNIDATHEFIRVTHERYKELCGDRLGTSIRGIFTDEPHRGSVMTGFGIDNAGALHMTPWTELLPQRFTEVFGKDILDHLPEIFLKPEGETVSITKWQYMEILQQMFLQNYAKPLYDWCEHYGMRLTGHALHEDSLTAQAAMAGSLMRFYEFMHDPGVDVLTEGNRNPNIVKQLSSAARQLGQKWLLSELYGCTGWQMNMRSHKEVGDWQALLGINLRCHHLSWYTMLGEAKRDYPASILHQSAWCKDYGYVETYFARLGLMLAQGEANCDIVMINPIESVWCQIGLGWASGLNANTEPLHHLENAYEQITGWLNQSHIDYDLTDEEMLGRLGSLSEDTLSPQLHIGLARYRAVIVPHMETMRSSTLQLLSQFAAGGGTVIFAGTPPPRIDCVLTEVPAYLAAHCAEVQWNEQEIVHACRQSILRDVQIIDLDSGNPARSILCQSRIDGKTTIIAAINTDNASAVVNTQIRVRSTGSVEEWDCRTGERFSVPSEQKGEWLEFRKDFCPSGERVFVISPPSETALSVRSSHVYANNTKYSGPFDYTIEEDNVCVLDFVRWGLDGSELSEPIEAIKADQQIRLNLNLPLRGGEMIQPWFLAKHHAEAGSLCKVVLAYDFNIETLPLGTVFLCVENPEQWEVSINNKAVHNTPHGWWIDNAFEKIAIPEGLLNLGRNTVLLETAFCEKTNIESVHLIGRFGVRIDDCKPTVTSLPNQIDIGSIVSQGFPFYGGPITYCLPLPQEVSANQAVKVSVPVFEAACIKVQNGDREDRMIAFPPYECEMPAGSNKTLDIRVVLTRRNTFGPLHQVPLVTSAYGPGNFVTEGVNYATEYNLYPAGILQPVVISW